MNAWSFDCGARPDLAVMCRFSVLFMLFSKNTGFFKSLIFINSIENRESLKVCFLK